VITDYEDVLNGDIVLVHAGVPVINAEPSENHDFSIVDLPEVEQTATIVHRRSMDNVKRIILPLTRWIDEIGHRTAD
jgi:effector-binding domain-containing protein